MTVTCSRKANIQTVSMTMTCSDRQTHSVYDSDLLKKDRHTDIVYDNDLLRQADRHVYVSDLFIPTDRQTVCMTVWSFCVHDAQHTDVAN